MRLKSLNSEVDAVIFDLDGTLVDSMWMWTDIDIEYLARYGYPFDPQLQLDIAGMSVTETALYFKEHYHIPQSIEEIIGDWIQMSLDKYRDEVPLKPYVRELLSFFGGRARLAIASSNAIEMIEACLHSNSIRDQFEVIVTSDQVERGKPYPDVYLHAAALLGVAPEKCLVFEDIPEGVMAARAAGMAAFAVYDKFSGRARAEMERLSDRYFEDFGEFLRAEGCACAG